MGGLLPSRCQRCSTTGIMVRMGSGVRSGVAALVLAAAIVAVTPGGAGQAAPPPAGELDGRLEPVAALAQTDGAAALRTARGGGLDTANGRVRVVVERTDTRAAQAVRAAGGEVVRESGGLVSAFVAPAELELLSRAPGVSRVRPPYAAVPAVVSQGVAGLNATAWHAAGSPGFRGTGVGVAVIDLGFAGVEATKAAGELPAGTEVVDLCPGRLASTNHGTGVAEVVHDVAPGATLTLICVADEADLAEAVAVTKSRGARVIVHSVLWLNTSRGDGSGGPDTPDAIAADARASGILWVNAAGNHSQKHWSGAFTDANADGVHEFAGTDTTNALSVASTGEVCGYLKWDDWPTTDVDFALEFVLPDGSVLASSTVRQDGDDPPTDGLCAQGGGNSISLRVRRVSGTGSPRLDLFWVAPGLLEHQVTAGSLAEPGTSPQVLAVGAICSHTQALQAFSSRGPTIGGRVKPDLVSFDAVSSSSFGPSTSCATAGTAGFAGTSAATPHVGGAAALVLEERPGLTPAELQAVLEGKSVDMAQPGQDNDTGWGRLFLTPDLPTPVLGAPSNVEQTTVTVAGTINPLVARTTYRFEYGPTTAYGVSTTELPASSTSASATLSGLLADTAYSYRLVATNPFGSGQVAGGTFTTIPYRPPSAATGPATDIREAAATLTAGVNPHGKQTTVSFQLGLSTGYGLRTSAVVLPAGNAHVPVAIAVGGLAAGATYHFRVVAENELGQTVGPDQVLTTTAAPAPPAIAPSRPAPAQRVVTVRNLPPRLLLRRPATAKPLKAVLTGGLARVHADISVDEAARLRLRVVDLKTGRTLELAAGSRLGVTKARKPAPLIESRRARAGSFGVFSLVRSAALLRGRSYALEVVAIDSGGRSARLRVRFTR